MLMLAGCQAQPAPSSSTPTFATEEEAFAAAEETYRAYVDALNQVDLSDPDTFEPVYEWTTGDAHSEARETFSQMHADGWSVGGATIASLVQPRLAGGKDATSSVELAVCLDVSSVTLLDATGQSVVSEERPDVQSMLVTLTPLQSSPTGWAISDFAGRDGQPSCD